MSLFFHLMTSRRFLPLCLTQSLGALNDNFYKNVVFLFLVFHLNVSFPSGLLVSIASGIFILPFFLFSALAGQLSDAFDKVRFIRIVKWAELLIISCTGLGFITGNVALLFIGIFLMGTHSAFFGPAKYAILPELLSPQELLAGNGLIEATTFLAILMGTLGGGLLISLGSHSGDIIFITSLMIALLGTFFSYLIPSPTHATFRPHSKIHWNIFSNTFSLIRSTYQERYSFLLILAISWFWFIGAAILIHLPNYVKLFLHGSPVTVSFLLTLFSLGIGIGSMLCQKILRGTPTLTILPFTGLLMTVFGADWLLLGDKIAVIDGTDIYSFFHHNVGWRLMFDLVGLAAVSGMYVVPLYTILQSESPKEHRSQVMAACNIMNSLAIVLASLLSGALLSSHFSVIEVLLIFLGFNSVVACMTIGFSGVLLLKRTLQILFKFLFRVEVKGIEHYHNAGKRVLIIANHHSFLDAALLSIFLPERCVFAINSHIAKCWWIKPFLSLVKSFPLDPTSPLAIKQLILRIRAEEKAVIFPEGRITVTGNLMKIYEGPGVVAEKAEASILPIYIEGSQFSLFSRLKGKVRRQLFPRISLHIFPAQKLSPPQELTGKSKRSWFRHALHSLLEECQFKALSEVYPSSIIKTLLHATHIYGANTTILEDIDRKPISYRTLWGRVFAASQLLQITLPPEKAIGILLPNSIGTTVLLLALQLKGRIPAMLNFSAGSHALSLACQTAPLKTIITSKKFIEAAKLGPVITALSKEVTLLYTEDLKSHLRWYHRLHALGGALFYKFYATYLGEPPSETACILFTSGSEGTPKGVMLSHQNIIANCLQLKTRIDFTAKDQVMNVLPMFHAFGLTGGTFLPLLFGVKCFLYPNPLHYRVIPELIYDKNITLFFATDTFLAGYAKYATHYDFFSIRYIFAGAEPLKTSTQEYWMKQYGIRILEGYGTTETAPALCVNTPFSFQSGTVGRLLPGIQYHLEPIEGIPEGGRLYVKGPNIMQGYLLFAEPGQCHPPETSLGQGWYDTGDIVRVDKEKFVTILGRAKRFAKIGGEMVSLTAIEAWIAKIAPHYQHAVLTTAHEAKGEAVLLITEDSSLNRNQLITAAKQLGISEMMIPKRIIHQSPLPLLGTGKIDYQTLRQSLTL